ncbi:MAG: D-alanyl-D-alanine carboxypeptidase family protein [Acidimicrobiales bacterium]|nr:D-alanyl-D-alanine carboxypeptidase family protein [Acidimicrobiales bacterium]
MSLSLPIAVGAQSGPLGEARDERDEVQDRRAEVADDIDVLEASDAEIDAVLDGIDARLAAQQAELDGARDAADEAAAAEQAARSDLRQARRDVETLRTAIAEMAVESFVHPPTVDLVQSLQAASLSDALLQQAYLDARAKRDLTLLDLLETAEDEAERRAADLEAAAAAAAEAVQAAEAALTELESERSRQQAFAADLQDRINSRLAEAAVLAELDAELADQIQAEQAALIERIPPAPDPVVPTNAPDDGGGTTTTNPPGSSTPPTTAPPTTQPPPPPPNPDAPPLRTVQGITVHAEIADDLDALLTAAANDGVNLSGWGYRSSASQIALRRAHCGPTNYDIWYKPAGQCSPPTAIPGRSLHEQGRAIDFTHNASTITSRSSPGFRWLADHAASYGLFNLPSEPWHWSTNGG